MRNRTWNDATRWIILAWGILHIVGGALIMATRDAHDGLANLGSGAAPGDVPADPGPVVGALLGFHGLNIVWFGIATILLARRRTQGSTIAALAVMAAADLGLLVYLVGPGHMRLADGAWGPLLLVLATATFLLSLRPSGAAQLEGAGR
jgi:hypothetical protein